MTTLALVHPTDLLAEELRELLDHRPDLWDEIRLLGYDAEEVGTLTETGGAAALITAIDESSFEGADIIFLFGRAAEDQSLLASLPANATPVAMAGLQLMPDASPDLPVEGRLVAGQPLVAGLNLETLDRTRLLFSPHPAAIGLAHLLHPLLPLKPRWSAASAILPASMFGQKALDELLGQARDMLSFNTKTSHEVLPGQLAFNMLDAGWSTIGRQVESVLGASSPTISVQAMHGGIFHGLSLSVHVGFGDEDPGLEAVTTALEESTVLDFAADPHRVGPKDIAGHDKILIAEVRSTGPGTYAWWAVLDQLTVGGAHNAIALLEALSTPAIH